MNIRYPIYEGVYRILTLQVRNRNAEHCLNSKVENLYSPNLGYIPQRKSTKENLFLKDSLVHL